MSELIAWIKKRRDKRPSIIVPATFTGMEEAKISALYDKKERIIENRVKARAKHTLSYKRQNGHKDKDGNPQLTDEPSLGDETIRHAAEESIFYGGLIGDQTPLTRKQFIAFQRLRIALESLQAEYGDDYPLTQTMARLTRDAKDIIEPFTVTRGDVDLERVTIPSGVSSPFGSMNVNLESASDEERRKALDEFTRKRAKELSEK